MYVNVCIILTHKKPSVSSFLIKRVLDPWYHWNLLCETHKRMDINED